MSEKVVVLENFHGVLKKLHENNVWLHCFSGKAITKSATAHVQILIKIMNYWQKFFNR